MAEKHMEVEAFARWPSHLGLQEHALSLVGALLLAARTGGQPAFDLIFDRSFDRIYALFYRIAKYDPERAQRLMLEVLLNAAERLISRGPDPGSECTGEVHDPD